MLKPDVLLGIQDVFMNILYPNKMFASNQNYKPPSKPAKKIAHAME